jgi:hypothetical protein
MKKIYLIRKKNSIYKIKIFFDYEVKFAKKKSE